MNPNEGKNAEVVSGEHWNEPDEAKEIANRAADLLDPDGKAARTLEAIQGKEPELIVRQLKIEKLDDDCIQIEARMIQTTFGVGGEATVFEKAIGEGGRLHVFDQTAPVEYRGNGADYWAKAYGDAETINRRLFGALKKIVGEGAALAISDGTEQVVANGGGFAVEVMEKTARESAPQKISHDDAVAGRVAIGLLKWIVDEESQCKTPEGADTRFQFAAKKIREFFAVFPKSVEEPPTGAEPEAELIVRRLPSGTVEVFPREGLVRRFEYEPAEAVALALGIREGEWIRFFVSEAGKLQ